jgi:type III secretion system YscJ/HrcJ family lipoprotein
MKTDAVVRVVPLLGALFLVTACGGPVELVQDLPFRDANEILVLFQQSGVSASLQKTEGEEGVKYAVFVDPGQEADARRLLVAHGLPREPHPGFHEATATTGMIPSAGDERMKLLAAKQGEINNALEAIEDVLVAKTLINIPEHDALDDEQKTPTTASVVLTLRRERRSGSEDEEPEFDAEQIKRIVANAVQGLEPPAVEVHAAYRIVEAPPKKAASGQKAPATTGGSSKEGLFKILAFGSLGLVVLLAVLLMLAGKQKKDLRRRVFSLQRQITEGGEAASAKKKG